MAYDENKFDFSTDPVPADAITFKLNTSMLTEDTTTDDVTGISEVYREATDVKGKNDSKLYNLNGQRVDMPEKGVYIMNGKKVVIK